MQTFKRQQHSYRELLKGMQVRSSRSPVPAQSQMRCCTPHSLAPLRQHLMLECSVQSIPLPLNGDEGAIRKYADSVEALKRKVGLRSHVVPNGQARNGSLTER